MKWSMGFVFVLVLIAGCENSPVEKEPVQVSGKDNKNEIVADTALLSVARTIIKEAYFCTFITIDTQGAPRARVMEPFAPEKNWEIWMATNPKSRKVAQIKNNSNVTLHYFDKLNMGYVSLMGKAYLIHDNDKKEQYWKEEWNAFYGNRTTAYLLIKFIPERIEVVSAKDGIDGDERTWQPESFDF
jgi:general stress protein 26